MTKIPIWIHRFEWKLTYRDFIINLVVISISTFLFFCFLLSHRPSSDIVSRVKYDNLFILVMQTLFSERWWDSERKQRICRSHCVIICRITLHDLDDLYWSWCWTILNLLFKWHLHLKIRRAFLRHRATLDDFLSLKTSQNLTMKLFLWFSLFDKQNSQIFLQFLSSSFPCFVSRFLDFDSLGLWTTCNMLCYEWVGESHIIQCSTNSHSGDFFI